MAVSAFTDVFGASFSCFSRLSMSDLWPKVVNIGRIASMAEINFLIIRFFNKFMPFYLYDVKIHHKFLHPNSE